MPRLLRYTEWLNEALTLSQAKKYTQVLRKPEAEERLDKILEGISKIPGAKFNKRRDRVYVPFGGGLVKNEVQDVLKKSNYSLKNYAQGVVIDDKGREMRLNKALMKLKREDLVNKVNVDKTRKDSDNIEFGNHMLVFSKRKIDIAGMSTGRDWKSCMHLVTGGNKRFVSCDIEQGSLICYLTKLDDTDLKSPNARILIKPWMNIKNEYDILYVPDEIKLPTEYGTNAPQSFTEEVVKILADLQKDREGVYELFAKMYPQVRGKMEFSSDGYNQPYTKKTLSNEFIEKYEDVLDGNGEITEREDLEEFITGLGIGNHTIHPDLTVDVKGNVDISDLQLTRIPIKFGKVEGHFNCGFNKLKSLKGCPREVGGDFEFNTNLIDSLEHCPVYVGGEFKATGNSLTTLNGFPKNVGASIFLSNNRLESLKGLPEKVNGILWVGLNDTLTTLDGCSKIVEESFDCSGCDLRSLEGGPTEVGLNYNCSNNGLKTLKGSPEKIKGDFVCIDNESLITLEGAPQTVLGDFNASACSLISLKGGPKRVNGDYYCSKNSLLKSFEGAPEFVGRRFIFHKSNIPSSEKQRIEKEMSNIEFSWDTVMIDYKNL